VFRNTGITSFSLTFYRLETVFFVSVYCSCSVPFYQFRNKTGIKRKRKRFKLFQSFVTNKEQGTGNKLYLYQNTVFTIPYLFAETTKGTKEKLCFLKLPCQRTPVWNEFRCKDICFFLNSQTFSKENCVFL